MLPPLPVAGAACGRVRLDGRGAGRPTTRLAMSPATPSFKRITFVASPIPEARDALERLAARYGNVAAKDADVIVALGGDGLMLQTLHRFMETGKPIDGMHRGTVGVLTTEFHPDPLPERPAETPVPVIHPLLMCPHP